MSMKEKTLTGPRIPAGPSHRWRWVGMAALSGIVLVAPVLAGKWRRRTYRRQQDRMDAYIRGCLSENRHRPS